MDAVATEGLRWDLHVDVDGRHAGTLPQVAQLLGLAPLRGIDVGIDRGGPVSWDVYERHGPFPYTGRLVSVTYLPGDPAPHDPAVVARAAAASASVYE